MLRGCPYATDKVGRKGWILKIPEAENRLRKARGQRLIQEEKIWGDVGPTLTIGALLKKYLWGYKSVPMV